MTTYIALLRGVNVGGHAKVAMADLRDLLTRLGLQDARSLLQSGNLVFRSDSRKAGDIERRLQAQTRAHLGIDTQFFVRSAVEWATIIAGNPFPAEAEREPGHLLVLFLKRVPDTDQTEALRAAVTGPEVVRAEGRQVYVVYPNGTGRSRLTSALIERKLGTSVTGRNWNTVLKLMALAKA